MATPKALGASLPGPSLPKVQKQAGGSARSKHLGTARWAWRPGPCHPQDCRAHRAHLHSDEGPETSIGLGCRLRTQSNFWNMRDKDAILSWPEASLSLESRESSLPLPGSERWKQPISIRGGWLGSDVPPICLCQNILELKT